MTPDEFAVRMTAAAKGVERSTVEGLKAGGRLVAKSAEREMSAATGGSLRLRGTAGKKNGAPKMSAEIVSANDTAVVVAGKPKGIWSMLDSGTDRHLVGAGKNASLATDVRTRSTVVVRTSKKGKTSTVRRRKVLRIGDRFVLGPFLAGGSPARHTFKRGVEKANPAVVETIFKGSRRAIVESLKG